MTLFSHDDRAARIDAAFADAEQVSAALGAVDVPADIASWLGRLHALVGVPFPYLVPDEGMLPPESIRFFRLDDNWARALLDGAFSIGRNLAPGASAKTTHVDRAVFETVVGSARSAAPRRRRSKLEAASAGAGGSATPWTGFLLRSRVVREYPGLGVNVYPRDGAPGADPEAVVLLPIRRLDRLSPDSDTLLCLVEGDAWSVEVHEAPELLHYGLDTYTASQDGKPPTAAKELRTFTRAGDGEITFGKSVKVEVGGAFRSRSPRVVNLVALAELLQAHNPGDAPLDSAQMGFAMTQGVGKVSFDQESAT